MLCVRVWRGRQRRKPIQDPVAELTLHSGQLVQSQEAISYVPTEFFQNGTRNFCPSGFSQQHQNVGCPTADILAKRSTGLLPAGMSAADSWTLGSIRCRLSDS